jgi:hypothetical protein
MFRSSLLMFALLPFSLMAQTSMRPLEELINKTDPGWVLVKEWIDSAKNKVQVLPADSAKSKEALYQLQVTSRSPMGAIVLMTGGILVDDGWIRILGSGSDRLPRALMQWNKSLFPPDSNPGYLAIADDAMGGFFLLNGGGLGNDVGKIYYFSPDNLEYEPMSLSYTEFLLFCFNNNLDEFYKGYRWKKWKEDTRALQGDKVYNFYPPLWTKEGRDIEKGSRKAIPASEQFSYNLEMRKKLGIDKTDTIGHE